MELLVLTILILTFIALATDRIWKLRIAAERVNIEHLVGTLRSALGTAVAASVVKHGSEAKLGRYQHTNPIKLLDAQPKNYLGEFETSPEKSIPGIWYFNRREGTLCYRVRFSDDLISSNPDDPRLIRFQIQLEYHDSNHNGRYDPAIDSLHSLRLVSLDNYH